MAILGETAKTAAQSFPPRRPLENEVSEGILTLVGAELRCYSGGGFYSCRLRDLLLQFFPDAPNLNENQRGHGADQAA